MEDRYTLLAVYLYIQEKSYMKPSVYPEFCIPHEHSYIMIDRWAPSSHAVD